MALTFFMGLRKGEIQGLQWGKMLMGVSTFAAPSTRGHDHHTQNEKSVRSLPLIQPVKGLLLVVAEPRQTGVGVGLPHRARHPHRPEGHSIARNKAHSHQGRV